MPSMSPTAWLIVCWLAVVNTALAFTLWNLTQRTLSAVESSIVNNTMLIQIAVLAWIFLGERLGWKEVAGLTVAALGVLLVQLGEAGRRRPPAAARTGATRAQAGRPPDSWKAAATRDAWWRSDGTMAGREHVTT
jgi:drug/metabolite transporter (DMT)-like permease